MKCACFSFTKQGEEIKNKIMDTLKGTTFRGQGIEVISYTSKEEVGKAFKECGCLIFVGAAGIATRLVAPFLQDKLSDPAVIVVDEIGNFVIPICSGHVGGANELSRMLAKKMDSIPVITTATDVEGVFSVDEFAVNNKLEIVNRQNIKRVSKKLLINQPINMAIGDDVVISYDGEEIGSDELGLIFKPIVIGIGCRKDKSFEEISSFFYETIEELNISVEHILGIASIDVKREEAGICRLAESLCVPFVTFSAKELKAVEGDFEYSEFVEETVGVSDVSARSAKALGRHGKFLLKKKKQNGMTISVYEKYMRITLDYEKN